jgi:signal transduction histidine kinase/ligand-binding sensor domain-containing protein
VAEGGDMRFIRLGRSRGLSQQLVTKIVQDDRGFLWFGTQFGLNRYDGYNFRIFKNDPADPGSLCDVVISSLFIDRSGRLWIGCDYVLDRYDPQTETFVHYRLAQSTGIGGSVRHISQDRTGMLWLSTGNGLYGLDPITGKIAHFGHDDADPSSLSSDDIRSSGEDRAGTFWVATRSGLDVLDRDRGHVTQRVPLSETRDFSFYEDRHGVFWILYASGNGLAILDRKTQHLTRYSFGREDLPTHPLTGVGSMLEDRNGTLWIGTFSDGLLRFDRQQRRFTRYRNDSSNSESLSENRVTTLFEDREGDMWVGFGTTEPGFFSTRPPPFEVLPFDSSNPDNLGEAMVNGIYEDRERILWMGTTGALVRLDRNSRRYTHISVPGNGIAADVLSIAEDRTGALWIGTSGQGLYRRRPGSNILTAFRHSDTNPTSLSNDNVIGLLVDHAGILWAATMDGLNRFNAVTQTFTVYRHSKEGRGAYYKTLVEDPTGILWIGSFFSGLLCFDPQSGQFTALHTTQEQSVLPHPRINSLLLDHAGTLWIGTQNGLGQFDPRTGRAAHYSDKDGLASDAVGCVLDDTAGGLWLGTSAGLSHFDPRQRTFRNYTQADGLPGPDLSGWRACFRSSSGEMFVGGFSGAVAFRPDKISDDAYTPSVALTSLQLFGKPVVLGVGSPLKYAIDYTDQLTLPHDQNSISFQFSALSFSSPSTNRYRYKLEGLDTGWQEVGSDRRYASYTTLPPGNYEFRVQGATVRGPWSDPGARMRITILPPWWATGWFRALAAATFVLALWSAYHRHMRRIAEQFEIRLTERVRERTRIARELHDSLLQGFQGLMFRLQAVRDMLPGRPDDAVTALDKALERGDETITDAREAVHDLRSSSLVESGLDQALKALGEEFESAPHPAFRVVVEGKPRELAPLLRDDIYRVAREAFRNAARHANARNIEAEIEYGESDFSLRIRDDGEGIDRDVLARGKRAGHWGLQGMRERAEHIGGRLNVWSERKAGTEIELVIPAASAYGRQGPWNDQANEDASE